MYNSPIDFLPCGLRLSSAPSEGCEESAISSLVEPVWKTQTQSNIPTPYNTTRSNYYKEIKLHLKC